MIGYFVLTAYGDCGHEVGFIGWDKKKAQLKFIVENSDIVNFDPQAWPEDIIDLIEEESSNTDKAQAWFMPIEMPDPEWRLLNLLEYLDGRGLILTDDDLVREAIKELDGQIVKIVVNDYEEEKTK